MLRPSCLLAALLVAACAGASDPPPSPTQDAVLPAPPPGEPAPAEPTDACGRARGHYFELRAKGNHCTRDDDCAEIYPGICSDGPYYVHVTADHAALDDAAAALVDACEIPACEMPIPLNIAHCEAGRCEPGRTAPPGGSKSCWNTKITYMESDRPYLGSSYEHLQGITPLHAVSVPAAGTLRISARIGCADCELMVSEHNTGMARLVKGTPFNPEPEDPTKIGPMPSRSPPPLAKTLHLEVPVTPGPYFFAAIGGAGETQLEVSLRDAGGRVMTPDRRGEIHLRICED